MLGFQISTEDRFSEVKKAADSATFRNLGHGSAAIRRTAGESIAVAEGPSQPGTPPHTRRRQLKRAIRFDVDRQKQESVIGPIASLVGEAGAAHEFGGEFRGEEYDERAFMGPALEANEPRFAEEWQGSIGE